MGKGLAKRHRQKAVERANEGNLIKLQKGKGKAFSLIKDKITNTDNVPASLKKLMQLQEASKKDEARRAARQQQHQQPKAPQAGASPSHPAATATGRAAHKHAPAQFPPSQPAAQQAGVPPSAAKQQGEQHEQPQQPPHPVQKKVQKHQSSASVMIAERIYKANAFEQGKKKKMKDSKKEYLERRKLMKKAGRKTRDLVISGLSQKSAAAVKTGSGPGGGKSKSVLTPVELKLKARQMETAAKFGEVADAPLKVQLKRKHWVSSSGQDDQSSGAGGGDGDDMAGRGGGGDAGKRMKKIFLSQMAQAEQRMVGGQQHPQKRTAQGKRAPGKGNAGAGGQGLLQRARAAEAAMKLRQEREKLRHHVVRAYQEQKRERGGKGKGIEGGATMASLAKLVQRSSAAALAGGQGGGQGGGK